MIKKLTSLYSTLKRRHLGALADEIPERYWSNFVCVGGASEQTYVVNQFLSGLPGPLSVLVVGVFGGRDFWAAKVQGHNVSGLDLTAIADCPGTVEGNAEGKWPFPARSFDVVIMGEILEHLIYDNVALSEAHRVLRSSGRLILSVPYLHDSVEYHVRVHTPPTIRRLVSASGFEVLDQVERPGVFSYSSFNYLNHFLAAVAMLVSGRPCYNWLLPKYGRLEWWFGHVSWIPRRLISNNWGGTVLCAPVSTKFDYGMLNRQEFNRPNNLAVEQTSQMAGDIR